jgi:hypothetical protein
MNMTTKIALLLKGGSLAALTIAGILLALAISGNPAMVGYAVAGLVGWLMFGNTIVEAVELTVVAPTINQKWFGAYKMFTLIASASASVFLLTALVGDSFSAMVYAAVAVFLCAIVDGIEAFYI